MRYKQNGSTTFNEDGSIKRSGLEPVGATTVSGHFVRGDIEAFVSPVTGEVISSRAGLREHEKRTGQTNDLDSLRAATQREVNKSHTDNSPRAVHERKLAIKDGIERAQSSGFRRNPEYQQ